MAALTAYVRKTGSDDNGGSSNTVSPDRTGTDGVTNGTTTFTSLTASFTSADVDKLINIVTKGRYRIATFVNSTTITLSGSPSAGSGLTWNLGGAVLTIGAILANANNAFQSGDTCYIGGGTYREVVTVAIISPTTETQIIGDINGNRTGDSGDVIWTAYTTDDITVPSANPTLTLNGRDFLTFKNILFIAGNTAESTISAAANSINITFRDCGFIGVRSAANSRYIVYTGLADIASNWLIDRCVFGGVGSSGEQIRVVLPTSSVADYDSNFVIQNCVANGSAATFVMVASSGALASKGGGVDILNCTVLGRSAGIVTIGTNISTTIPCTIYNCLLVTGSIAAIDAGASGQILEDYNRIFANTARVNVTAGLSSISDLSHAPLFEIGYAAFVGRMLRPYGTPMAGSPLLGRATAANLPPVDILNRPRPAGGLSTLYEWGAYARHDTAARETATLYGGSNSIVITGPGDHDFAVPVDATLTTFTVYAQYDTNHSTFNKPQMKVLNGEEIGVSEATVTMALGANLWELLTLTFTPTAKGIVTVRFISRAYVGSGKAFFDEFSY